MTPCTHCDFGYVDVECTCSLNIEGLQRHIQDNLKSYICWIAADEEVESTCDTEDPEICESCQ